MKYEVQSMNAIKKMLVAIKKLESKDYWISIFIMHTDLKLDIIKKKKNNIA